MAGAWPFSAFMFSLSDSTNPDQIQEHKIFKICISPKALAGILEGVEGSTRKRRSSVPPVLSLFLAKFQRSFAQDRQLRASKDEDENKDDKEEKGGGEGERREEEVITENLERYTNGVSLPDPP